MHDELCMMISRPKTHCWFSCGRRRSTWRPRWHRWSYYWYCTC